VPRKKPGIELRIGTDDVNFWTAVLKFLAAGLLVLGAALCLFAKL
jgi:hypothetical protein